MRDGAGIFLLVLGAVLAFAVQDMIKGVDLRMIGSICMAGGVLAQIFAAISGAQDTRTKNTQVIEHRDDTTR